MPRPMPTMTVLLVLALAACSQEAGDDNQPAAPVEAAPLAADVRLSGKEAYDLVCAECHEEGLNGAPRTGDREAWAGRSWLWEAVLFEHAKEGYENMPARGGDESLDDTTVEMAAEYMLTRTFPELSRAD